MASIIPAKTILKQPSHQTQTLSDEQRAQASRNKRHLDIALQHAYLIQHQKDVEAQILKHIEGLVDFPHDSQFTEPEAHAFTRLISIFQPSNFDELVEERNAEDRCGYVLCAHEPRSARLGTSAAWKLPTRGGDWCSDVCARKAMFVKSQLSEVPAWERAPTQQVEIVLHEDDRAQVRHVHPSRQSAVMRTANRKVADQAELASERGDKPFSSLRPRQVIAEEIVEKQTVSAPQRPGASDGFALSRLVDGYKPVVHDRTSSADHPDDHPDDLSDVDDDRDPIPDFERHDNHAVVLDAGEEEQQWRDMFAHLNNQTTAGLIHPAAEADAN